MHREQCRQSAVDAQSADDDLEWLDVRPQGAHGDRADKLARLVGGAEAPGSAHRDAVLSREGGYYLFNIIICFM